MSIREDEVEVDLDNPGTDSGSAAVEMGVDLDNPAGVGSGVALLVASQSPGPLSWFRIWCPFPRTWYLDLIPSSAALKNLSF